MKKIYVADVHDEDADARLGLFEHAAQAMGVPVEVITFADGASLHERAMTDPPDLVVVGMLLPAVSGLAVCRLLRYQAHLREVPIYISGWSSEPDLDARTAAVGASGFLPRPWTPEAVARLLDDAFVAPSV